MTANRWREEREFFQTRVTGNDVTELFAAIGRENAAYHEWHGEQADGTEGNFRWYIEGDTVIIEWEGSSHATPASYRYEDS